MLNPTSLRQRQRHVQPTRRGALHAALEQHIEGRAGATLTDDGLVLVRDAMARALQQDAHLRSRHARKPEDLREARLELVLAVHPVYRDRACLLLASFVWLTALSIIEVVLVAVAKSILLIVVTLLVFVAARYYLTVLKDIGFVLAFSSRRLSADLGLLEVINRRFRGSLVDGFVAHSSPASG